MCPGEENNEKKKEARKQCRRRRNSHGEKQKNLQGGTGSVVKMCGCEYVGRSKGVREV